MEMTGNALSSLIFMGTRAPEASAPTKTPLKSGAGEDDSFSGIFREKMHEASKPQQGSGRSSVRKPLESATGNTSANDEKPGVDETKAKKADDTVITAASADKEKAPGAVTEKTEESKSDDSQREQKPDNPDGADNLSLIASLLESLFGKLKELVPVKTDENAQNSETVADGAPAGNTGANPLEMLKTLLGGQTDRLKELIGKLQAQPETGNTGVKTLLEELQALISKVEQIKNTVGSDANGKIVIKSETGAGDQAALLAQLKAQGNEIMERLKVKFGEAGNNAGTKPARQDGPAPLQANPNADNAIKTDEAAAGNDEPKTEARETRRETAEIPAKAENKPESVPKQPFAETMNLDSQVQSRKPETTGTAKTEKPDFYLSEKPLSQTVSNQVMMKIKLMAGENRQEMEVSLKPESLGKLTLKIVHERGEILARITAESEQVKSILESNMQLLKDSLEKSGFSVQGLNVSLGNNSNGSKAQDQGSRREKPDDQKAALNGSTEGRTGRIAFGRNLMGETSSIDLSA